MDYMAVMSITMQGEVGCNGGIRERRHPPVRESGIAESGDAGWGACRVDVDTYWTI